MLVDSKLYNYNYIAKMFNKFIDNSICFYNKYIKCIDQEYGHVIKEDLSLANSLLLNNIMK